MFEWLKYRKQYTGVKVLAVNYVGTMVLKRVYDNGNGAFILSYMDGVPRYLTSDGKFTEEYRYCNGDAKSWRSHLGDVSKLNFKKGI